MLERDIDRSVVAYAKQKGWIAIKLSTLGVMGSSGWPDRLFIGHSRVFFVEMKAPGKSCTELQRQRIEQLQKRGMRCYVCSTIEEGKRIVDKETE